jgi:hypothetical protein
MTRSIAASRFIMTEFAYSYYFLKVSYYFYVRSLCDSTNVLSP